MKATMMLPRWSARTRALAEAQALARADVQAWADAEAERWVRWREQH